MRVHCTYCNENLGIMTHMKDRKESLVMECQNPKCKATWGRELDYKEHL